MKTVLHIVTTDAAPAFNAAIKQIRQSKNQREHSHTCYRSGNGPDHPYRDPKTGLFSPCENCCYYYKDPQDSTSQVLLRDVIDYETVLAAIKAGAVEA
jgi:meiotically up-regulated gene 157 (Mug157) protein